MASSLTDGPGYACFEAVYDYAPQDPGELELKIGDQCFVSKPIRDPNGWLTGVNMRSKEYGQFPGTYCKIVDYNAAPPRPKKPTPGSRVPLQIVINGHTVEKICVVKPVWCSLCDDYIWGGGKISLICSACLLCAHSGCHQLFNVYTCSDVIQSMVKPKGEIIKPVVDWMPDEFLEWMVAARLHPYVPLIRGRKIFGKDVGKIDEHFLMELGITFDLHIKFFKICIDELLKPPPTAAQLAAVIPLHENTDIKTHLKIYDHTFTTNQLCNICDKPLFGIFRQGIMCAICGLQCHRPCAFAMNRQCNGSNTAARRSSVSEDPSFCCNFTTTDIPPVMQKCVGAVEKYGLNMENVYMKDVPYDQFQHLKSALNQMPDNVNMNDEYWRDPGNAAHVLKTFLLELPIPLLHTLLYEDFMNVVRTGNNSPKVMAELYEMLPEANRSHLNYLLKHLIKLSRNSESNGMTFERISQVFSFLIIRPPDNEAYKFVLNFDLHENVVSSLLSAFDNWSKGRDNSDEDIESEKWLWSHGTRKEVSQCLLGKPDGSFLIRPSEARKGEWTLTVTKEGKDRLIKIISRDGLFGFREDLLKFSSLKELVLHFIDHSLKDYNDKLDMKLKYPCAKPEKVQTVDDENTKGLKDRFQQVSEKLKEIKCIEYKVEEQYKQFEECKSLSESQTDVVNFIEEQISLAELQYLEVSNQDKQDLHQSLVFLNKLLTKEKSVWGELDDQLSALNQEYTLLKAQHTELSTELPNLRDEYNQLEPKIRDKAPELFKKEDEEEADDIIETYYDHLPSVVTQKNSSNDLQESSFKFGHLEKSEILRMLENKPDGTFLVRKSRNHPYAISLVHEGQIKHIPILKGPNGYGFAEPHNTYKTLHDLVNHYHNQSLRLHNRMLDTTLQIPYKLIEHMGDEPIYDVMGPSLDYM